MDRNCVAISTWLALLLTMAGNQANAFELEVEIDRPALNLGQDQTAMITVHATGQGSQDLGAVRIVASIGRVSQPRQVATTEWAAAFSPPSGTSPRVAMIVAYCASGDSTVFGAALLPLRGQTTLGLRSDPGAAVSVDIAGEIFGPVQVDRNGIAQVAVEVPPGVSTAIAISADRFGGTSRRTIPIPTPDYRRLMVIAPDSATVSQRTQVAVIAITREGTRDLHVELTPSRGSVRVTDTGPIAVVYELHAPDTLGDGTLRLHARANRGGQPSASDTALALRPGAPASIALTRDRESLVPGSTETLTIGATVRDRFGNIRDSDSVALETEPPVAIESGRTAQGGVSGTLVAPRAEVGLGYLTVTARSGELVETTRVQLVGGPAALARIETPEVVGADGRTPAPIRVLLVGETGLPSSDAPTVRATRGTIENLRRADDGWWDADFIPPRSLVGEPSQTTIEAFRGTAAARRSIRLTQPLPLLSIGLSGGVLSNVGALLGPTGRLEISTQIRLPRGWLEIGAFGGFSGDSIVQELDGEESQIHVRPIPLAAGIGFGFAISPRLTVELLGRGGAVVTSIERSSSFQTKTSSLITAAMMELAAAFGVRLWIGEARLRVAFAYAPAPSGSDLRGNLLGISALIGYRVHAL